MLIHIVAGKLKVSSRPVYGTRMLLNDRYSIDIKKNILAALCTNPNKFFALV